MGIPLESAKSSSNKIDEPRLPNTAGKSRKTKSSLTSKQGPKKSIFVLISSNLLIWNDFVKNKKNLKY